ncbi:MAG: hypothetical protein LBJ48_00500 [Coriobacteriales bacterium]|jgi:hypothetical protein|nr:hypothetical protein [Coriobacteriales bacterium]
MGYKEKMAEGNDATGDFTFAQTRKAVESVAYAMGKAAVRVRTVYEEKGTIVLDFFATSFMEKVPSLQLSKEPYITAMIAVAPDASGTMIVSLDIAEAYTTQAKTFGIPSGPKNIHGLSTYRDFCDLLVTEFSRMNPSASIARR